MESPVILINREMGSNLWQMRPSVSLATEGHLLCCSRIGGGKESRVPGSD
jgi:hypothetical protein